jgi:AraC-like DNA-binding protein/quercetin dioxygenase-like cupin family protein
MNTDNTRKDIKVAEDLYEKAEYGSPDYPVAVFHVVLDSSDSVSARQHRHEELEYILVMEGTAEFSADRQSFTLSKGQGLFLNSGVLHSVHPIENKECVYYSLVFHSSLLFDYRHSSLYMNYMVPLTASPDMKYFVFDDTDREHSYFLELCRRIMLLNENKSFGYELLTKGLLLETWVILLQYLRQIFSANPTSIQPPLSADEERAKAAITYIAEHYAEPLSLQNIAESVHISKSECCRCFKRCLQTTPFEYLIKYRVYTAASLFAKNQPDYSISDIAGKVGFNSSSYFNKMFKKYMSCTPTEFRRRTQGDIQEIMVILSTRIAEDPTFRLP